MIGAQTYRCNINLVGLSISGSLADCEEGWQVG
jgi:hypothetical protein